MKQFQKLKGAEAFGVKVTTSKALDKYAGKVLFPEKLKTANKMLAKLKIS